MVLERSTYVTQALPGVVIALSLVFFATHYAYALYQTSVAARRGLRDPALPLGPGLRQDLGGPSARRDWPTWGARSARGRSPSSSG